MALVRASSNCFTAFNEARHAVKKNDANRAAIVLQSVQSDAKILQRETRVLHKLLVNVEEENEAKVGNLTVEINQLYQNEQHLKEKEKKIAVEILRLKVTRQRYEQHRKFSQIRQDAAEAKQREAEQKHEEYENNWWNPVLWLRELSEQNKERARKAEGEKNRHARDVENADSKISLTKAKIDQVHQGIEKIRESITKLKEERDKSHRELGEYKAMTRVALEVLSFSEVLINMTSEASLKTGYLQRIMAMADKRKTNVKQSRGMRTAVNSFEDSWMDIIEMMDSNRISILTDTRLVSIYDARYANTYLFDILVVIVVIGIFYMFC